MTILTQNPELLGKIEASILGFFSIDKFSQIIDCLSSFIGKSNIVGHNLPFDLKFLYHYGYNKSSYCRW